MRRFILTGGLGTGKTTIVSALGHRLTTVAEPARELIREHRAATGQATLDDHPDVFVERLIVRSIDKYRSARESETTLFDRGLPDCLAYAEVLGVDPGRALEAASAHRYEPTVFITPPWEEIYTTDDMRRATFNQAVAFHSAVRKAYTELRYELVVVPKLPVEERAGFVADRIGLPSEPG